MKKVIIAIGLFIVGVSASAQIEGTSLPSLPNLTTAEMNSATGVYVGSSVFNTDEQRIYTYTSSGWVTNTDSQQLTLNSANLEISNGNSVDLSTITGFGDNIYTVDGILTGDRAVTQNNFDLNFDANTLVVSGDNDRVGVGTDTPLGKLHVSTLTGEDVIFSSSSNTPSNDMDLDMYRTRLAGTSIAPIQDGDALGGIRFNGLVGAASGILAPFATSAEISVTMDGTVSNTSAPGKMDFITTPEGSLTKEVRMTIKPDGNIGIGTETPNAKLDVENGTVRFSDYGSGTITGTATNILAVDADGDIIEVGATTFNDNPFNNSADDTVAENGDTSIYLPGSRLQVGTDGSAAVAMTLNDGGGNANITFNHTNRIPDSDGSSARIRTDVDASTSRMHFELADNVTAGAAPTMTTVMDIRTDNIRLNQDTDITGNLDVNGTARVRNLPTAADTDQLVTADANGNMRQVNSLRASKVFYPPSIAIDASTPDPATNRTIDLHAQYIAQFGSPVVSSAGTIPTYAATELDYHVTFADPSVFGNGTTVQNMSVDANGILTYRIYNSPADYNALINVVFVVK
ncbi:hypothetical protein ACFQZJ_11450 [Maribacter chungangensis]|uniref:Uncharacterized protein n=1 Tax=Maribacter chungangensis TaxID=1069117 RepID=A0ABW3B431_9FLAO